MFTMKKNKEIPNSRQLSGGKDPTTLLALQVKSLYNKLIQNFQEKNCSPKICLSELESLQKISKKYYPHINLDYHNLNHQTFVMIKNLLTVLEKTPHCKACCTKIQEFLATAKKNINLIVQNHNHTVEKALNAVLHHCSTFNINQKNYDLSDLKQEGYLSLIKAFLRYDPSKGPFEPYALQHVYQAMKIFAITNFSLLTIHQKLFRKLIETKNIKNCNKFFEITENLLSTTQSPEMETVKNDLKKFLKLRMSQKLSPKEEFILRQRIEENKSLENIAKKLNTTKQNISFIEKKIVRKLTVAKSESK